MGSGSTPGGGSCAAIDARSSGVSCASAVGANSIMVNANTQPNGMTLAVIIFTLMEFTGRQITHRG
jgi:hypothetical protein